MVWLDGGHNGTEDTWVTNPDVVKSLAATNIKLDIRVTPYQVK